MQKNYLGYLLSPKNSVKILFFSYVPKGEEHCEVIVWSVGKKKKQTIDLKTRVFNFFFLFTSPVFMLLFPTLFLSCPLRFWLLKRSPKLFLPPSLSSVLFPSLYFRKTPFLLFFESSLCLSLYSAGKKKIIRECSWHLFPSEMGLQPTLETNRC